MPVHVVLRVHGPGSRDDGEKDSRADAKGKQLSEARVEIHVFANCRGKHPIDQAAKCHSDCRKQEKVQLGPNVSLERLPLGSPLEGRVGLTCETERACRAGLARQTKCASEMVGDRSQCRTPKVDASGHRARRASGALRADARAARNGLAAARRVRTDCGGKARQLMHEGQILHLPNV